MAYNTKEIIKDKDGNPISQYYNPETDQYEPVEGQAGANKVVLYNADGTENNSLSLIPILEKLSQLTGTVIDEETRKSNELQRQELYNQILNMLETGQLKGEKGDKGDTGLGLEFDWQGTMLGVRVEGETEYVYVDLRGPQGPPGTIENLTSQHIETALGYIPADKNNLDAHKAESVYQYEELKYSELSSIATNIDSEGIYKNIEWKRKDNTIYAKSTLIGTYPYPQIKIDYYDETGTTIIKTITWDLTYDDNDFPYTRTVI